MNSRDPYVRTLRVSTLIRYVSETKQPQPHDHTLSLSNKLTTMKALICRIAAVSTMARAILHFHSFTLQTSLKRIKMTIALLIAYRPTKDLLQHILTQNYSKRNEDLFSSSDLLSRCYHLLDCTRVCKAQQSSKNQRYLVELVLVPTCFPPYLAGGFMGATPPQ